MAWFERDDVRVYLGLLNADFAEQFRKPAARLAAQGGKDLGEQSDQSLGRRGGGVEVPRAQVPLLQNQRATGPDQPPMRCHLLAAASERSDQVAGVDEIEGLGLQLAVEQIIDGELHVGDPFCLQKGTGGIEQALVYVGAYDLAGGADPLAEDPKPAQGSAADVQGA